MTYVAIIIMLVTIAGIVYGFQQNGITPSSRASRYDRIRRTQHSQRASRSEARQNAILEGIKGEWIPQILRSERKAASQSVRAGKAIAAGKDAGKHMKKALRYDQQAATNRKLMTQEINTVKRLHEAARSGNRQAQSLVGRVHPKTGKTVGGIGRSGHRPSDHVPRPKTARTRGKKPSKSVWDILVGQPKKKR